MPVAGRSGYWTCFEGHPSQGQADVVAGPVVEGSVVHPSQGMDGVAIFWTYHGGGWRTSSPGAGNSTCCEGGSKTSFSGWEEMGSGEILPRGSVNCLLDLLWN